MQPVEVCELCGQDVSADDVVRSELTVGDMMCPTPMAFHKACYEQAGTLWQPDPDSYCTTDPEFPETGQWSAEWAAQQRVESS